MQVRQPVRPHAKPQPGGLTAASARPRPGHARDSLGRSAPRHALPTDSARGERRSRRPWKRSVIGTTGAGPRYSDFVCPARPRLVWFGWPLAAAKSAERPPGGLSHGPQEMSFAARAVAAQGYARHGDGRRPGGAGTILCGRRVGVAARGPQTRAHRRPDAGEPTRADVVRGRRARVASRGMDHSRDRRGAFGTALDRSAEGTPVLRRRPTRAPPGPTALRL